MQIHVGKPWNWNANDKKFNKTNPNLTQIIDYVKDQVIYCEHENESKRTIKAVPINDAQFYKICSFKISYENWKTIEEVNLDAWSIHPSLPADFWNHFPKVRVLNIKQNNIQELPPRPPASLEKVVFYD